MSGNDNDISQNIYLRKLELLDVKKNMLCDVHFSILTTDVYNKYKDICRFSQMTFLHRCDKIPLEKNIDGMLLDAKKNKIFVYPESIEYFFKYIYKFIKHSFILHTFKCYYTEENRYKIFDYNNHITKCVSV